jgi:hypothetical protein
MSHSSCKGRQDRSGEVAVMVDQQPAAKPRSRTRLVVQAVVSLYPLVWMTFSQPEWSHS